MIGLLEAFTLMNDLPTKPGPYYWRESDGDEFQLVTVEHHIYNRNPDVVHLSCYSGQEMRMLPITDMKGQWLPIPPAEELVELLWRVHNVLDDPSTIELRHLGEYINKLRKGKQ